MRAVVWNVAGALRHGRNEEAESLVWGHLGADVALFQEVYLDPEPGRCVGRPFDGAPSGSSHWGSYVVSRRGGPVLEAPARTAVGQAGPGAVEDSYPGATAVATVEVAGTTVFLVSAYGALLGQPTRHAETTMHRILSDLTDLITSGVPLLLAGDFNITTQPYASNDPGQWWHRQEATVFGRPEALEMVDLIAEHRPNPDRGLPGCPCGGGAECTHVRTTRHQHDPDSTPYQNDWAFGTKAFAALVKSCSVQDAEDLWAVSEHAPIVIDL